MLATLVAPARRKRVLSVASGLYAGGDERRLLTLAKYIDRDAFDHSIVCIRRETQELGYQRGTFRAEYEETDSRIVDLELDVEAMRALQRHPLSFVRRGTTALWRSLSAICRIVRSERIDVIDAHVGLGNRLGITAGLLTRTPTLVTVYNQTEHRHGALAYLSYQLMLRGASGVVTDDDWTRKTIEEWMLLPPRRMFVIPSSMLPPQPTRDPQLVRREIGLPNDPKARVIGMVANLLPFKGQSTFLEAASRIAPLYPKCIFLIAGFTRSEAPQSYIQSLWDRATELGIADRVRIVSYHGHIGDVWQLIDIHVHPSMKESAALAIIESMSLRKPLVATDVGATRSLVIGEYTGLIVPPAHPGELASAVLRLLDNPGFAEALGNAAFERYCRLYSKPESMVRRMEDAFHEVAGVDRLKDVSRSGSLRLSGSDERA